MDIKQNPFSFYDFLGYFTPGAIFIYLCIGIVAHLHGEVGFTNYITQYLSFDKAEVYLPFVLLAYVVGHILNFLSSVVVERYSLWTTGYPSKYLLDYEIDGFFSVSSPKAMRVILRVVIAIIMLPVSVIDAIFGNLLGAGKIYAKPLDQLLITLIKQKMVTLLQYHGEMEAPPEGSTSKNDDYFRFIYHYCVEYAPNHFPKMQNYVALYGFLRSLCLLSVILFWVLAAHICTNEISAHEIMIYMLASVATTYVLYMAFVKFYRRFTLEAFMALSVAYTQPNKGN